MKKTLLLLALVAGLATTGITVSAWKPAAEKVEVKGSISFSIYNDTSSDFPFYLRGGKNYINRSVTNRYNEDAGAEFYYYDNGKGKLWFKVTSDMNGKDYKLSQLID